MGLLTMNDAARSAGRPDGDDAPPRPSTRSDGHRASLAMFVGLTFAITWLLWIPGVVLFGDQLSAASPFQLPGLVVLQTLGAAGPSIAAWIMLRRSEGRRAIRRIGDRYRRWKVGVRWYVVAVLLVPVINVGVLAGDAMIGDDAVVPAASPLGQMLGDLGVAGLVAVFPLIVASNVFSSPLLEEFGWRGFAVPAAPRSWPLVVTGLVVGVLFLIPHLALHLPGNLYDNLPMWPLVLIIMSGSMLFTWAFTGSGGSVVVAALMHATFNGLTPLSRGIDPVVVWQLHGIVITAIAIAVVLVSRRVRQPIGQVDGNGQPAADGRSAMAEGARADRPPTGMVAE
jgi:membrane protease YdiL (CAAX protease family)